MTTSRWLPAAVAGSMTGLLFAAVPAHAQTGQAPSFTKDVLPILQKSCQNCHGVESRGGLKLDSLDNVRMGGVKGQIVTAGNAEQSRLVQYIEGRLMPRMPIGGRPLSRSEIATIRGWISAGARDDSQPSDVSAAKPLTISTPKDGSEVREQVKVVVPRSTIPPNGFVAVYIDSKFRVALAPPSEEEAADQKLPAGVKPADAPITYVWDTQAPISDDGTTTTEDRFIQDGPHVIEIRSYKENGAMAETVAVQVNVKNSVEYASNYPAKLMYGGKIGQPYFVENRVDLQGTAAQGGRGRFAASAPGPDKINHLEEGTFLVSLEDVLAATGAGFWRERRESPLVVTVNGTKNTVRVDSSSRYYTMDRRGDVRKSRQMDREKREPIVNPIDLPGRPQRMNETFTTNLRVNLGGYIPGVLSVERLQATLEGIEWQKGERCVRIRLDYIAGKSKIDIKSMGLTDVDFDIQQGSSTLWFSEETSRFLLAKHDIKGTMEVDTAQLGGASAGGPGGGMGGEGVPGEGGIGGGYPGAGGGYPGAGGGYPGAGGGYPGAAGGGGSFGSPYGGRSGGAGPGAGGYPGAGGGYPGAGGGYPGAGGGYPGAGGGFPGAGGPGGGGSAVPPPAKKRYFTKLKVVTEVVDAPSGKATASR